MYREIVRGMQGKNGTVMVGRGKLINVSYGDMISYAGERDMFYSHFGYKLDSMESEQLVNHIVVDFDVDGDPIPLIMKQLELVIKEGFDYSLYYSGSKGFHIVLPNEWGFTHDDIHNKTVLNTVSSLFNGQCDITLYNHRSLVRMPNTINGKSGLYKRRVDITVLEKGIDAVKQLCRTAMWENVLPNTKQSDRPKILSPTIPVNAPVVNLSSIPSPKCIHTILRKGPEKGKRHQTTMRLLSHLIHYDHYSEESAHAVVKEWWERSGEVFDEHWYSRNKDNFLEKYKYGCNDEILRGYCNHNCKYFDKKTYNNQTENIDIMKVWERFEQDIIVNKRYYDLADIYPDILKTFIVYNNDVMGIAGPPGAGKSAFVMDMVMRILSNDKKSKEFVCWSNLDTSHDMILRRCIQWHIKVSREDIMERYSAFKPQIMEALKWIKPRINFTEINTLEAIDERISNWENYYYKKPSIWVIDHIGNFKTSSSGYERMAELGENLKDLAKKHYVTFFPVGHIRKKDATDGLMSVSSFRDANIGEACDVMIGLRPRLLKAPHQAQLMEFMSVKARDNGPFSIKVWFDPDNFRFKRHKEKDLLTGNLFEEDRNE